MSTTIDALSLLEKLAVTKDRVIFRYLIEVVKCKVAYYRKIDM